MVINVCRIWGAVDGEVWPPNSQGASRRWSDVFWGLNPNANAALPFEAAPSSTGSCAWLEAALDSLWSFPCLFSIRETQQPFYSPASDTQLVNSNGIEKSEAMNYKSTRRPVVTGFTLRCPRQDVPVNQTPSVKTPVQEILRTWPDSVERAPVTQKKSLERGDNKL